MSNALPLFPVPANNNTRSVDENVKALAPLCHVCEVAPGSKSGWTYALVHASPVGVARIASELGLKVYRSRRGDEYYSVVVAEGRALSVVPQAPASAPQVRQPAPAPVVQSKPAPEPGVARLDIRGTEYFVRQTSTKRRIDVLRFEVRKDHGDVITEPYVVSFQDEAGRSGACSCLDWIYRRREKGDCKHIHAVRAAFVKPRQATIPLGVTG